VDCPLLDSEGDYLMEIKKITRIFVAYGVDEDQAFENIMFDLSECIRRNDCDEFEYETVDSEVEGVDIS
jgi:hypothetical protein